MFTGMTLLWLRLVLRPFDLLLHLVGPHYRTYLWFFSTAPAEPIAWLGSLRAIRAAERASRRVPAYRSFLQRANSTAQDTAALRLPETSKQNYVSAYPPDERCVNGNLTMVDTAIDESSGSTGTPYNWIRSMKERHASHLFVSHFARYCYGDEPWITINAFSMGAWATGVNMGMALQRNSLVKNTGPDLLKIFSTLEFFGTGHRYLICGYPPFLKRVIDCAREQHFPLDKYRLMGLLGGEGNSEGLRDYLSQAFDPVYSGYGATDVEIGVAGETAISLAIRRAARSNDELKTALFGHDSRLPMVFQYNPLMHHIETSETGELIFTITRLNLLQPRIRYNVHDAGGVATLAEMERKAKGVGVDLRSLTAASRQPLMPLPFLWIYGRKDSTVSVMGANIYPEDLEQCLYDSPGLATVTNSFCLGLVETSGGAERPLFSFEVRGRIDNALQRRFEAEIVERLRTLNADFREAYREDAEAITPLIRLWQVGEGPFSQDSTHIKQTRLLRAEHSAGHCHVETPGAKFGPQSLTSPTRGQR